MNNPVLFSLFKYLQSHVISPGLPGHTKIMRFVISGCLVIQPFSVTDNMRRLKQEKEQLLKSGVYEESDRIIQEINHQIKEALLDT